MLEKKRVHAGKKALSIYYINHLPADIVLLFHFGCHFLPLPKILGQYPNYNVHQKQPGNWYCVGPSIKRKATYQHSAEVLSQPLMFHQCSSVGKFPLRIICYCSDSVPKSSHSESHSVAMWCMFYIVLDFPNKNFV